MNERRGEWPSWVVGVWCAGAFVCGLFVSWAVFAVPAKAAPAAAPGVDRSELLARIEALESAEKSNADLVIAKKIRVVDDKGRARITLSAEGSPAIQILHADGTVAMWLFEEAGEPEISLWDSTGRKARVVIEATKDGKASVALFDADSHVRVGMQTTPAKQGEFVRFDKNGNAKAIE